MGIQLATVMLAAYLVAAVAEQEQPELCLIQLLMAAAVVAVAEHQVNQVLVLVVVECQDFLLFNCILQHNPRLTLIVLNTRKQYD